MEGTAVLPQKAVPFGLPPRITAAEVRPLNSTNVFKKEGETWSVASLPGWHAAASAQLFKNHSQSG